MSRAPILFRVDSTPTSSREFLARELILAAALQRRRRGTYFLAQLDPAEQAFGIKRGGNDWLSADHPVGTPEDLEQVLREVRRMEPAAVIVDSPNAGSDYLAAIQNEGPLVVSLDHLANVAIPSRLLINPLLGPDIEAYEFSKRTQVLMGSRYALIRPDIRRIRPLRSQEPAQPFRLLIALGDDDPNQQAGELAKLCLNCSRVGRVDILAGAHYPHREALQALVEQSNQRLEIATEPAEVSARLVRGHLALTAGNGWSQELACLGIPQLIIVQNEVHWPAAQRLDEECAATCLGWHENVSAQTIRNAVHTMLGDAFERQSMSRCGRKLFDGRGPDRMVNAMEIMLHAKDRMVHAVAA